MYCFGKLRELAQNFYVTLHYTNELKRFCIAWIILHGDKNWNTLFMHCFGINTLKGHEVCFVVKIYKNVLHLKILVHAFYWTMFVCMPGANLVINFDSIYRFDFPQILHSNSFLMIMHIQWFSGLYSREKNSRVFSSIAFNKWLCFM